MPSRYKQLLEALRGYQQTGIPLVADNGTALYPAGVSDDIGIYYLIPKFIDWFGLSLQDAIILFFVGTVVLSLLIGVGGSIALYKRWDQRLVAVAALLFLSIISLRIGDVYVVSSSITVATVPWFLYTVKNKKFGISMVFAFLVGLTVGTAHSIRSHSGTAALVFMGIILLFSGPGLSWKRRFLYFALLIAGLVAPLLHFHNLLDRRDAYLLVNMPGYEQAPRGHPFWHSVYIGFGFLNNEFGIIYKDEVAIEKVRSVAPGAAYLSSEYASVMKKEVLWLVRYRLLFVIYTLLAKSGVILLYILVFANLGLPASYLYPKPLPIELAFWGAMGFSSIFGLLVMPNASYLLGLMAFATLYGIISINHAIEQGNLQRISRFIRGVC